MDALNLHAGGELVSYDAIKQLPVPAATDTHFPVAHHRLIDAVRHTLGFYGHEIVEEHHAVSHEGNRYFGLLTLRSEFGDSEWPDYAATVGLRNSNDKSFPIGIAFGGRVFVCSNLSFYGDHIIRRKHTQNAWRDVHGLLAGIIEPLAEVRKAQHQVFDRYKATALTDTLADHAIMELYRKDVLNAQRIPVVAHEWEEPSHDWGDRTAWRLFNACTFALQGRVAENPALTRTLHNVIDGVCETVH